MIKVGIVDDHPVVLDGLATSLVRQPEIDVVWSAATLADARRSMATIACDVVLVDVRLPDGSGLDLVERAESGPAFVVLSSFDQPPYARAAYQRGASGYVLKTAPIDEIVSALRIAVTGGTAFRPKQLARLAGPNELTDRELDIVRLVADGWSNDEVAARLSISTKTVEAYLTRLFERWHVATRTELSVQAEREGWLDPSIRRPGGAPKGGSDGGDDAVG